jgi:hypothetical protein
VRELTHLLRNRAIQPAISIVAVLESMYAVLQLVARPHSSIQAVMGHVEIEARRLAYDLGMPILYAPGAPLAPVKAGDYWSDEANLPGRFWPFVLAQSDVRRHPDLLARLGNFLSSADAQNWRNHLLILRRATTPAVPHVSVPKQSTGALWTPDPFGSQDVPTRLTLAREPAAVAAQAAESDALGWHALRGE